MNVFKLLGLISINNSEANSRIDETSERAGALAKVFKTAGSVVVGTGKVIATGLAAGVTAFGKLTYDALQASGELEQNMGGSEAVFKQYASSVQATAKNAYSQMGLSTSDFLATANKMGSLFQGAGFGISESADIATQAMQRAADVASIMGIDTTWAMESIAGAAKGNFTMMDNLGVAMNETTLAAYALEQGMEKSYSQMTQQEKIGVAMKMFLDRTAYAAGNYAKENKTLAGALNTAKAAMTNFLDGSGDVDQLVDSFTNAAEVIVENVSEIAPRLASGLEKAITKLSPKIPELFNDLLPAITAGGIALVNGFTAVLPGLFDALIAVMPSLVEAFGKIFQGLIDNLPQILSTVGTAIGTIMRNNVWPAIQNFFKVNFGVDLPDWDQLVSDISDGWNKIIWPGIQEFFKKAFNIELPDWDQLVTDLDNGWTNDVWPNIQAFFRKTFGIDMPDWVQVKKDIQNGWDTFVKNSLNLSVIGRILFGGVIGGPNSDLEDAAKWNAEGAVFSKPTLFASRLGLQGVGEAGPEAVAPIDVLQGYVRAAVDASNAGRDAALMELASSMRNLTDSLPDIMKESFASMRFEIGNREFARMVKGVT